MSRLQRRVAEAFAPLLQPARYKGAHGGRGSGKSHFFAEELVFDAVRFPGENGGEGMRGVCIREVQKSLKQSAKRLVEDKIEAFGLSRFGFRVWKEAIETPRDGIITFEGMNDHTADSIKSLEGFQRAWVEEAQTLSGRSLELLRPTIRAAGSQLWFSWNPRRPVDPVDQMLRSDRQPTGTTVIEANWRDNPWFPAELEQERLDCLEQEAEKYGHIWEGQYARVYAGAYFADLLEKARLESRIAFVPAEPLVPIRAYWDLGATSRKSDATAIWIVQFIGPEVRVLNYYEARGQAFSEHVDWLRHNGYQDALCRLPHDGKKHDVVYSVTPQGYLQQAGFDASSIGNAGTDAARKRIDAVREVLPACRFNEDTTQAGRDALAWYHEKKDETRDIGLGPEHDWSSHAADAFGAMAIDFLDSPADLQPSPRRNIKGVL